MIKAKFGDRLDGWIHAALPFLFHRKLNPNVLTVIGTLVSLLSAAGFATGRFRLGAILLLAGGFFDLVDGVVARHHGTSTAFGAFLDSSMDRLVDMVVLLGIVVYYGSTGQAGVVVLTSVVLVSSVMTSYAKARAEHFVSSFGGGIFERGERIGLLAFGGCFDLMVPTLWVLAVGTTYTVVQRFALAYREMGKMPLEGLEPAGDLE